MRTFRLKPIFILFDWTQLIFYYHFLHFYYFYTSSKLGQCVWCLILASASLHSSLSPFSARSFSFNKNFNRNSSFCTKSFKSMSDFKKCIYQALLWQNYDSGKFGWDRNNKAFINEPVRDVHNVVIDCHPLHSIYINAIVSSYGWVNFRSPLTTHDLLVCVI